MRFGSTFRLLFALLFCSATGVQALSATVHDRIGAIQDGGPRTAVARTVHPDALAAKDLGFAPSSQPLDDLSLHFAMTAAQQASLDELLRDQQDAASPRFRQWLTPEQFGEQFGMSPADLATTSTWLASNGLTVTGVARSANFITFSGTVGQVERAFGTRIHRVSMGGDVHLANLTDPLLPASLAATVTHLSGLNDFRLKPRVHRTEGTNTASDPLGLRPNFTIRTSNGLQHFVSPGDFFTIYNENPALTASVNGTGVTIAVMGQVDLTSVLPDFAAFRSASGLSANVPSITVYGTNPGFPTGSCNASGYPTTCNPSLDDVAESELDVEWANAIAPGAHVVFVNSTNVLSTSLIQAIANNLAPIMTVSYGLCEAGYSPSSITTFNNAFQQANAQGITVFGPTGDEGATDCEDRSVKTAVDGLNVDFPASSPYVTAVGGTEFTEGADAATPSGTYWNNTSSSANTALSYIPETIWNDTVAGSSPLIGGGGGQSTVFAKPIWQYGTGVPNDGARDVPDVALNASSNHDPYLFCFEGSCQNGSYLSSTNQFQAVGGTSVSTPAFAGILALVEQKQGGVRLGNINPLIYSLANGPNYNTIFHDVTAGNNNEPCLAGSLNCPTGGSIGYSAGVGYDLASGWGSVDVTQLVNRFSAAVVPSTSTTALAASSTTPAINASVTFTATVSPTSASGTVTFTLNGKTSVAVPLSTSGVATYATTFTSGGPQTISASYGGSASLYPSSSSLTINVAVPSGAAATTTSLTASPNPVVFGNLLTLTATVSSTTAGTIGGDVIFSSGSTAIGRSSITGGTAVFAVPRSVLTVGTDTFTASYGGSSAYNASASPAVTVTVSKPSVTLSATNITTASGMSGTSTLTIASIYTGNLTLAASTTSTLTGSYNFTPDPVTVTAGGTITSTFTIISPKASLRGGLVNAAGVAAAPHHPFWPFGGGSVFAGLLLLGIPGSRRRRLQALLSVCVLCMLGAGLGCGSSSSTAPTPTPPTTGGTFSVTITATDLATSIAAGTTTFNIIIQ